MIALGCDHGGYELKQEIKKYLDEKGIEYKDYGCDSLDSVDYPVYAKKVAHAILDGECEKGILICGTGIGISITANKFKGIRAAEFSFLYNVGIPLGEIVFHGCDGFYQFLVVCHDYFSFLCDCVDPDSASGYSRGGMHILLIFLL